MVRIRFQRLGRRNRSCFRIVVTDARKKRQGEYLEKIGQYDPVEKDAAKQFLVDAERVKHWLGQGAQLSEAVAVLLKHQGVDLGAKSALPVAADSATTAAPPAAPAAQ
jgi:small subunit ribosomal protein S16